ncbi:hypothetical protein [Pseudomonas viridiflava]|uniref:hypothetical protein n=1 Tax=Pseudomonas viridiflava TaxID=33069 RepID=UPI001F119BCF|nr:hypothetical protein [Pseudomonas viridiflava]
METQTLSAASQSGKTRQSAGMEKVAPSRSGQFSQILKRAESSRQERSITPASATLSRPVQPRSSFFMQNMSIEQRRSAVEEKGFSARPAAMERVSASMAVQAGRSKETFAINSQALNQAGNTGFLISPPGFNVERSNGNAQKRQMLEEAKSEPNSVQNIIESLLKNTLTFELLDIRDYPIIRYAATGEPVTKESRNYYSNTLTSILEQRTQLYGAVKKRGATDMETLETLLNFNDSLPHRFRKMANW